MLCARSSRPGGVSGSEHWLWTQHFRRAALEDEG